MSAFADANKTIAQLVKRFQFHTPEPQRAKELLQRQIDATDKKIDQLVYELYGLTDKEIRIVEGET